MNILLMSINDWLGPLMAIGPLKIALLTWIGLEIAKRKTAEAEQEPAPLMPIRKDD